MASILLAEDDELLRMTVIDALTVAGHKVTSANTGTEAMALCEMGTFDLVILDWNMPGHSGIQVGRCYREQHKAEPILFLTSRSDLDDKEMAFSIGADDFLTKPFQLRELMMRVTALLRRPVGFIDDQILIGNANFDIKTGIISLGKLQAKLQPREAELLLFFLKRPKQVLKAELIRTAVWGSEFEGSDVALRACLAKVRKALAVFELDECIETVHGFGYQYNPL